MLTHSGTFGKLWKTKGIHLFLFFFSVNLKPIKIKENASWIHGQPLAAASPVHGISGAIGQPSDDLHFGESCRDLQLDESIPNILASSQQLYGHSSFLPQSRFVSWHSYEDKVVFFLHFHPNWFVKSGDGYPRSWPQKQFGSLRIDANSTTESNSGSNCVSTTRRSRCAGLFRRWQATSYPFTRNARGSRSSSRAGQSRNEHSQSNYTYNPEWLLDHGLPVAYGQNFGLDQPWIAQSSCN